jgi:Tfp pilus assembly protein PilV
MVPRMRQRLHGEDGISLVEVLVTVVLLAVVLAATLSTIVASLRSITENEAHVRATALSNELLERMAAAPWNRLGLYVTEVPATTYDGQSVVLLPVESTRDAVVARPAETLSRDGRQYDVERWITWVDGGTGQDYKRLVVELTWEVGLGQERTMRSESYRAPNPNEFVDLTVEISSAVRDGSTYDEFGLVPGTFVNAQRLRLDLETNYADATLTVTFTDRGGVLRTLGVPGPGLTRTLYINAGQYAFPNGPVTFAVLAETGAPRNEDASNTETMTAFQNLVIGAPALTHSSGRPPICVDASGLPTDPVTLEVAIEGASTADAIAETITVSYGTTSLPLAPGSPTPDGGTFRVDLPGPFTPGPLDLVLTAARAANDPQFNVPVSRTDQVLVQSSTVVPSPC